MNFKKFFLIVTLIVSTFVILSSIIIFQGINIISGEENVSESKERIYDNNERVTFPDIFNKKKRINTLILGTDGSGQRSDVIIIMSADLKEKKIKMLSIPRDTRVIIDGHYQKINAALLKDEKYVMRKITELTSIPLDYYAVVNFKGFRNIVDIVGGVDFYVPTNMYYSDPYQNLYIDLKKGIQHLDGEKAEQLVRYRRYENGDIGRIRVQQDFLKALMKKTISFKNLDKIDDIIKEVFNNTKTNIEFNDIIKYINNIKMFKSENINMYRLPGDCREINGVSYFIHDEDKTIEIIQEHFGYQM